MEREMEGVLRKVKYIPEKGASQDRAMMFHLDSNVCQNRARVADFSRTPLLKKLRAK